MQTDYHWSKSQYDRFGNLGKDNYVPGPERYFNPPLEAAISKQRQSLRSMGTYRGPYLGKQSESVTSTHGFDGGIKERFKNSFYGSLDNVAQLPGPGQYFEGIHEHSTLSPPVSPRRPISPIMKVNDNHNAYQIFGRSRNSFSLSPKKTTLKKIGKGYDFY